MSTKRSLIIALSGVVIVAIIGVWVFSLSLLRSEASIRASLLKQTPLGTSSVEVRAFIDKQKWVVDKKQELDYWIYLSSNDRLWHQDSKLREVIFTNSFNVHIGHYWLPLPVTVTAFWGLDTSNRLIDIWVVKDMEGI
jgi:hypothetical protein